MSTKAKKVTKLPGRVIASGVFGLDPVDIQFDFTPVDYDTGSRDLWAADIDRQCYHALVAEICDALSDDHDTGDEFTTFSDEHSKARHLFTIDIDSTVFIANNGAEVGIEHIYQEVFIWPEDNETRTLRGE
jgi:hypothetical protein